MSDSIRPVPSTSVQYGRLPLESESQHVDHVHESSSTPSSPQAGPVDFPAENLPPGAARPRFMGNLLGDDGPQPRARDSFASYGSHGGPYPSGASEYDSVYGLNPGQESLSHRASPIPGAPSDQPGYRDDPDSSYFDMSDRYDQPGSKAAASGGADYREEKRTAYAAPRAKSRRKWGLVAAGVAVALVIAIAVVVALYFTVIKPKNNKAAEDIAGNTGAAKPTGTSSSGTPASLSVITGGDGSKITTEDGTTFTYSNSFGGSWYFDENDPFNNAAQAQSFTPALNETFNYGVDLIRG